jgi:F0F1-type ATP synthase assembly protein I
LDDSQRRELSDGMFHRSSGSFELALAPVLAGLLGYWLDTRLGTTPLLAVVFAMVGIAGAVIKTYYVYRNDMDGMRRATADARAQRKAEAAGRS